jgi:adenine/guanine phosphoribosyltransferase-like PRPP-binding protein
LQRANAEGAPHITGADFPSSGTDFVTALATELGFPFLPSRKKNCGTRAGRTQ